MHRTNPRRFRLELLGLAIVIIGLDLGFNAAPKTFVISSLDSQPPAGEPLQVPGMPLLRPGTVTLGEGLPVVSIAASDDSELPMPAPIDASLSYEQVNDIVRRALDLDQSGRSLRDVIARVPSVYVDERIRYRVPSNTDLICTTLRFVLYLGRTLRA